MLIIVGRPSGTAATIRATHTTKAVLISGNAASKGLSDMLKACMEEQST